MGTLTEYRFRYSRPAGGTAEMSREVYDRGHAGAVLLHNHERDTVVLVRQFRSPPMINGEILTSWKLVPGSSTVTCRKPASGAKLGKRPELWLATFG